MHSCWHTHRAVKGAGAVTADEVVRWATAGGARVLGMPQVGTLAVGQQADIAVFDLDQPRHFGMHDPLVAPETCGGSARVRHLLVGGRLVVDDGAIPGLDLAHLRSEAAGVVRRLAA
jgi:cytosine/adenosine deaminase-related metal-dependent hydrolase